MSDLYGCRIYICDMTHSYVWHDAFILCDMTQSYVWRDRSFVWHDSFIRVTWLIHTCDVTHSYVWHDSFIRVTWNIHTCDVTHSFVWRDSFICVTWLIHTCDVTHSYVWRDSFIRVTWLIHTCDVTHAYVTHSDKFFGFDTRQNNTAGSEAVKVRERCDSITCVTWAHSYVKNGTFGRSKWFLIRLFLRLLRSVTVKVCDSFIRMTWLILMCDMSCHRYKWGIWISHVTHINESCHAGTELHAGQVVLLVRMCHGTQTYESWHTYEWVISHVWTSHITQVINCALIEATDAYNGVGKCIHIYMYTYIYKNIYVYMHMCICMHIYLWICTFIHLYVYTYMYIYIHIHK